MNDHERGCQGREYTCTCGHDDERDALIKTLLKALEPFALISTEGVVTCDSEYSTITTVTEYFHDAAYALAVAAAKDLGQ